MEKKIEDVMPYLVGTMLVIQIITIALVMAIPTAKQEFVCRGLFTSPNNIMCFEQ